MRLRASPLALGALVGANLIPLIGVTFFGWRLYDVMVIYWLENGVVGAFTLARMVTAGSGAAATIALGPFFTFHYGMFWLVHGVFVVSLFGGGGPFPGPEPVPGVATSGLPFPLPIVGVVPAVQGLGVALAALAASHGASFVQNWLVAGERAGTTPAEVMKMPYGRVVVLHLTLIFGGFAVMALGAPVAALVVMVLLKIGVDVAAHLREHRGARAAAGRAAVVAR